MLVTDDDELHARVMQLRDHGREPGDIHFKNTEVAFKYKIPPVAAAAATAERVMVVLDSNHTQAHVLRELELYAPLVTKGCYLVVCDTLIEDMPAGSFPDRPWDKGDNPRTAVDAFLKTTERFEVDTAIDAKLQISVAPGGYLKCVAD